MTGLKKVLSVFAIFVLIGSVIAGITLINQSQEFREKAAPATSLTINPSSQTKLATENFSFSVLMNTGENQVTGFDLDLVYNPAVITIDNISSGSGISGIDQTIRNNIDNVSGRVLFSKFTLDSTRAVSGSGVEVAVVNGTIKADAPVGSVSITFGVATAIAGISEGQNVLVGTVPGIIEVVSEAGGGPGETETPAGSEDISPTETPVEDGEVVLTETPEEVLDLTPTDTPVEEDGIGGYEDVTPTIGQDSSNTTNNDSNSNTSNSNGSSKKGDINKDGKVNISDLSYVLSNFNKTMAGFDLNGDGKITILDLSIVLSNWGK